MSDNMCMIGDMSDDMSILRIKVYRLAPLFESWQKTARLAKPSQGGAGSSNERDFPPAGLKTTKTLNY